MENGKWKMNPSQPANFCLLNGIRGSISIYSQLLPEGIGGIQPASLVARRNW